MNMRTILLKVPDKLDLMDFEYSMILAAKLYEEAKLSAGQAAEMVGLSKWAFIELLNKFGVSVLSNSILDLHSDIENA
jgi:predicted HTH domain antitoxin